MGTGLCPLCNGWSFCLQIASNKASVLLLMTDLFCAPIYSLSIKFFWKENYVARFLNGLLLPNTDLMVNNPVELTSVVFIFFKTPKQTKSQSTTLPMFCLKYRVENPKHDTQQIKEYLFGEEKINELK